MHIYGPVSVVSPPPWDGDGPYMYIDISNIMKEV